MAKPAKQFSYLDNQAIDKDMKTAFDWVSRVEVVTTNPDGNRTAQFDGEIVKLESGGSEYLEVARARGSKIWRGVLLTDTP